MTYTKFARFMIAIVSLCCVSADVLGQSVLDEKLVVAADIRPLDALLRAQLREWFDARDAALSDDGKQTAEWWAIDQRLNPITVHGQSLLDYGRANVGKPESFVCLAYILDWGEGSPPTIHASACEQLITHYRNNPAVSWLCSRCANPLYFEEMRSFLTRLREVSINPNVQAAATFHLAELLDATQDLHSRIGDVRENFEKAGMLEAFPAMALRLKSLEKLNPNELAADHNLCFG